MISYVSFNQIIFISVGLNRYQCALHSYRVIFSVLSVTTHPYFIPLSLSGRGWGEGDSCIRVRAWVLYALYSWMVTGFPDLNVFEYFFQFIKNSMAIILPSSACKLGIIGAEPVSNYISRSVYTVSSRIVSSCFHYCSVLLISLCFRCFATLPREQIVQAPRSKQPWQAQRRRVGHVGSYKRLIECN